MDLWNSLVDGRYASSLFLYLLLPPVWVVYALWPLVVVVVALCSVALNAEFVVAALRWPNVCVACLEEYTEEEEEEEEEEEVDVVAGCVEYGNFLLLLFCLYSYVSMALALTTGATDGAHKPW